MALTLTTVPGLWAAARTKSVASGLQELSDIIVPDATCIEITITVKAANDGTAVSGDIISFMLVATSGDADNDATDDYAADDANMHLLATVDTFNSNDSIDLALPYVPYGYKIAAISDAPANAITVSFTTQERRSA